MHPTPAAIDDHHIPGFVRGMVVRIADTLGVAPLAGMVPMSGVAAVNEAITEFTGAACDELRVCLPHDRTGERSSDAAWRLAPVRPSTHVRAIVDPGLLGTGHVLGATGRPAGCPTELRVMSHVPMEFVVTDRHRALLVWNRGEEAVAMGGSALLFDVLVDCFDSFWATAAPPADADPAPATDGPLDEDDRVLLLLMASGSTDRAIARRLAMSTRTVQRRIHELMQRLGTESRFQAGITAAAKGWV